MKSLNGKNLEVWINPIFNGWPTSSSSVGVILHFWVTLLNPSSKSSILKFLFLFTLLIPVFLQTLSMDKLPMISFLAKIISCLAFNLGVLQPLSTSSDTVYLETGGAVIRSLTIYYVIEEERVKKAGKEPSIRVNKKSWHGYSLISNV